MATALLNNVNTTLTTLHTCTVDVNTSLTSLQILPKSTTVAGTLKVFVGDGTTDYLLKHIPVPVMTVDNDSAATAILVPLTPTILRSTTSPALTYTIKIQQTVASGTGNDLDLKLEYTQA